jgi:hypothetical protein
MSENSLRAVRTLNSRGGAGHLPSKILPAGLRGGDMLYFHKSCVGQIQAAKATAGVPVEMRVDLKWEEVAKLFATKGVDFKVHPAGVELVGVGFIPTFMKMSVQYTDKILPEGGLEVVPSGPWCESATPGGGRTMTKIKKEVEEFLSSLFPAYRPELSEQLVQLPIPPWVEVCLEDGWGGGGIFSYVLFRSQAEQMKADFVRQLVGEQ